MLGLWTRLKRWAHLLRCQLRVVNQSRLCSLVSIQFSVVPESTPHIVSNLSNTPESGTLTNNILPNVGFHGPFDADRVWSQGIKC